jgi:hypothetical protein
MNMNIEQTATAAQKAAQVAMTTYLNVYEQMKPDIIQ